MPLDNANRRMAENDALLRKLYAGFNRRDMDAVLAHLSQAVIWANGMDGGHLQGREAVRDYWTKQWTAIVPHVDPISIVERDDGTTAVEVRQVVRDLGGTVILDEIVTHVFRIEDRAVARFDIENAGGLSSIGH